MNKEKIFVPQEDGIGFYYEADDGEHGEPDEEREVEVEYVEQ